VTKLMIYPQSANDPVTLSPGDNFPLDRRFVTGGLDDVTVSARHPPQIFYAEGEWMIRNHPENRGIVIHTPDHRAVRIGPGSARTLAAGYSEIFIATYKIGIEIEEGGAATTGSLPLPAPYEITLTDGGPEEKELKKLLDNKPMYRTIIYVRFQQYISPYPKPGHNPAPLTAAEVLECYPDPRLKATVDQACREIRDATGLTLIEIGPWLVERGLLLTTHNIDIPHVHCGHRSRPWR
jgi:hypothetical protein